MRINSEWSPPQAMAVMEMLDDLRELIAAHYQPVLQELMRLEREGVAKQGAESEPF
jgi:hypothetical protein